MKRKLTLIIILAVLCLGVFTVIHLTHTNVYQNSKGFEEFADKSLNERELFRANKNTTVDYTYNETLSVAVQEDAYTGEKISEFRDDKVNDAEKQYLMQIIEDRSEDLNHACIIDTSVKRSDSGATSLVVYQKFYEESGKDMVLKDSAAKTYLFDTETGKEIKPLQAMTISYRDKASEYAKEYLRKSFSESKFAENWKDYLVPKWYNFNNFIITGQSVIFYFQPGTVVDEKYGVISLKIPQTVMESYIRPKVLDRCIDPNQPMVALTYDDGPGGKSEARILDCLEKYNCSATFFYQGYRMNKFGYNAKRAAELGCDIGNHSWNHPVFSGLSKKQMKSQLDKTNKKIEKVTGITPQLFRPPYGDYNGKVTSVAKSRGMSEVLWTVDTRDWESRDYRQIVKNIKKSKHLDGKIILMHSIYDDTAKATEQIVPWLDKYGFQMVTISELVEFKTGKGLKPGKVYRKID